MGADEMKAGGHVKEIGWRRMDESKSSSLLDSGGKKEKTRGMTQKKKEQKEMQE